jgi:hypothetical protein
LNWLFSRTVLDEGQKTTLRQAQSWEQFFGYLCSLDGFLEQLPAPPPRQARPPVPFKPATRPAVPAPVKPSPPPPALAGPSNAELMAKLDRLEAMLAQVLAGQPAPAGSGVATQAAAALPRRADLRDGVAMDAAETLSPTGKAKPSSRRQAR